MRTVVIAFNTKTAIRQIGHFLLINTWMDGWMDGWLDGPKPVKSSALNAEPR